MIIFNNSTVPEHETLNLCCSRNFASTLAGQLVWIYRIRTDKVFSPQPNPAQTFPTRHSTFDFYARTTGTSKTFEVHTLVQKYRQRHHKLINGTAAVGLSAIRFALGHCLAAQNPGNASLHKANQTREEHTCPSGFRCEVIRVDCSSRFFFVLSHKKIPLPVALYKPPEGGAAICRQRVQEPSVVNVVELTWVNQDQLY